MREGGKRVGVREEDPEKMVRRSGLDGRDRKVGGSVGKWVERMVRREEGR